MEDVFLLLRSSYQPKVLTSTFKSHSEGFDSGRNSIKCEEESCTDGMGVLTETCIRQTGFAFLGNPP